MQGAGSHPQIRLKITSTRAEASKVTLQFGLRAAAPSISGALPAASCGSMANVRVSQRHLSFLVTEECDRSGIGEERPLVCTYMTHFFPLAAY
jgi:hypothetical protein